MSEEPKKRKKATSNVVRSMAWCDERGLTHQKVERWQPYFRKGGEVNVEHVKKTGRPGVKIDLWGGIDILLLDPQRIGVTGLQCCTDDGGVAKHIEKLLGEPRLREFVERGNRLLIHGWAKRALPREPGAKRVGKRRKVWTLREVELKLADFDNAAAADTTNQVGTGESDSVAAATTNESAPATS